MNWYEQRGVTVEAVHLAGRLDVDSEEESCAGTEAGDCMLDSMIFARIGQI